MRKKLKSDFLHSSKCGFNVKIITTLDGNGVLYNPWRKFVPQWTLTVAASALVFITAAQKRN